MIVCLILTVISGVHGEDPKGKIFGKVSEMLSKEAISGVYVQILNAEYATVTDDDGSFKLEKIPIGNYSLQFSVEGFNPVIRTDIIVRSKRITSLEIPFDLTPVAKNEVNVSAGYFHQPKEQPASSINFTREEIRRAPGSAGDVSRIIANLPSIAKISDNMNTLVVRGGNPIENSFFVDNIEIPNINHFPTWGSTGGPIGLINVDFIQDVNFYSGGFSSQYGDRLSSVMDIGYREGNREEMDFQLDLHMAGFGMVTEGPLLNGKGSYLLSARKSFLDLLVAAIGTGVAPRYSDFQGKIVLDLNAKNKLIVMGIAGIDRIAWDREEALDSGQTGFGNYYSHEYTVGLNWFSMWGQKGHSNTSISHSTTRYKTDWYDARTQKLWGINNTIEQSYTLRNINHFSFNHTGQIQLGFQWKHIIDNQDYLMNDYVDITGNHIPEFQNTRKYEADKGSAFLNLVWNPLAPIHLNVGLRADYFSYNKNTSISPRLSVRVDLSSKFSVHGAFGIFTQNLPIMLLSLDENNDSLLDPRAYHYIIGFKHLITDNTQLTVELYDKEYYHFPVSEEQPLLFYCDEFIFERIQLGKCTFRDTGRAQAYGIELSLQKKLAHNLYGLVSASYFRTRYMDMTETWRDRIFDNQYIFSVEGGYKPNNKWEFSVRWILAGGIPYTPFDIEKSTAANTGIFNDTRINEERQPPYHSLNIRCDKRFHFKGSSLIFYLSVWNAYNRKNISNHYWNSLENREDIQYQWSLLPIFGMEFEF